MSNQLTFNNITLSPIVQADNQIWLSSSDLAKALGYSQENAVAKIFNRNADEFSENMTQVIDIFENTKTVLPKKSNNLVKKIRIFSLRGCHLIAMFSRTKIAKQFRIWVLDILDKEVGQPTIEPLNQKTTKDDRTPLRNAVSTLIGKTNLAYDEAYRMVHQFMGVNHIDEIALDDLPKAVAYVHSLTLMANNQQPVEAEHLSPHTTNEFKLLWKCIGLHQYHEVNETLRDLEKTLYQAENQLRQINKNRSLIYDALAEPSHPVGGKEKVQEINAKAMAFIERKNALKFG